MRLSNLPPRGTYDWFPEEYRYREYIFNAWRQVCRRFGYSEYLTPLLEEADIYRAKSGEDLGGKELFTLTDRAGRELALRPEMTPSVTRMVSRIYDGAAKPLRLYSIANFFRNEKPQRGRNREFWQLNYDVFGTTSELADLEIVQIALEIMAELGAPENSFVIRVNNRFLLDAVMAEALGGNSQTELRKSVQRLLDKYLKLTADDFATALAELGLSSQQVDLLVQFLQTKDLAELLKLLPTLSENSGYKQLQGLISRLHELGYTQVVFSAEVIRGLDYYDGMVFEAFDLHPENQRALFGGGRYDGLARIFGIEEMPAVGAAPGDETLRLFLESWQILPARERASRNDYYLPLLDESLATPVLQLAQDLRAHGYAVTVGGSTQRLGKALNQADKQGFRYLVILGAQELENAEYKVKDLLSGSEEVRRLS